MITGDRDPCSIGIGLERFGEEPPGRIRGHADRGGARRERPPEELPPITRADQRPATTGITRDLHHDGGAVIATDGSIRVGQGSDEEIEDGEEPASTEKPGAPTATRICCWCSHRSV